MSYMHDHMAWQQRVQQESNSSLKHQHDFNNRSDAFFKYPNLTNYIMDMRNGVGLRPSTQQSNGQNRIIPSRQSRQSYGMNSAFGQIKRSVCANSQSERPDSIVGGGRRRSLQAFLDSEKPQRQLKIASRVGGSFKEAESIYSSNGARRNSASFQIPRKRFNEVEVDNESKASSRKTLTEHSLHSLAQLNSNPRPASQASFAKSSSRVSINSRFELRKRSLAVPQTELLSSKSYATYTSSVVSSKRRIAIHKKKIYDVVDQLSEGQLKLVTEMLVDEPEESQAIEEEQELDYEEACQLAIDGNVQNKIDDFENLEVKDIEIDQNEEIAVQEPMIIQSAPQSEYRSTTTKQSGKSKSSRAISMLQSQITEEREHRVKLEKTIEQLQLQSKRIFNKLNKL